MYYSTHHPGGIVPTSPVAIIVVVVERARSSDISHKHAAAARSHYTYYKLYEDKIMYIL